MPDFNPYTSCAYCGAPNPCDCAEDGSTLELMAAEAALESERASHAGTLKVLMESRRERRQLKTALAAVLRAKELWEAKAAAQAGLNHASSSGRPPVVLLDAELSI